MHRFQPAVTLVRQARALLPACVLAVACHEAASLRHGPPLAERPGASGAAGSYAGPPGGTGATGGVPKGGVPGGEGAAAATAGEAGQGATVGGSGGAAGDSWAGGAGGLFAGAGGGGGEAFGGAGAANAGATGAAGQGGQSSGVEAARTIEELSVSVHSEGIQICSGTWIAERSAVVLSSAWVITSAACIERASAPLSVVDNRGATYAVVRALTHPSESANGFESVNVALLQVDVPRQVVGPAWHVAAPSDVWVGYRVAAGSWETRDVTLGAQVGWQRSAPSVIEEAVGAAVWQRDSAPGRSRFLGIYAGREQVTLGTRFADWLFRTMMCATTWAKDECTEECPCTTAQGACSSNAECVSPLLCVPQRGGMSGLPSGSGVCLPSRSAVHGASLDTCAGVYQGCSLFEGGCAKDEDCALGLACRRNAGPAVGLPSEVGICELPRRAGCPPFNIERSSAPGHCTPECPCGIADGDCDEADARTCRGDLVCAKDVGAAFGFSDSGVDVCVAPEYLRPDLESADADRIWIAESGYRFRRLVSPTRVPAATAVLGADFDGDKLGDLLVYAEGVQLAQIWFGHGDGTFSSSEFPLPGALYVPAVGDIDGDGRSDILWYGPGAVLDEVWRANQDRTFKVDPTSIKGSSYRPIIADFDGDGPGDIFWYAPGAERDSVWWGSAFAQVSSPGINWFATALPGDFDGDARADLLFAFAGEAEHYLLPGSKDRLFPFYSSVELPALWPAGSADFDGDGRVDLLSKSSEVIDVRYQRGPSAFARVPMPLVNGDAIPVSLDVDGDGKTDIYWRRP